MVLTIDQHDAQIQTVLLTTDLISSGFTKCVLSGTHKSSDSGRAIGDST